MRPDLSVVIPTYNGADWIKETLEALVTQTLDGRRFEIIVVDDGSTDRTECIVAEFAAGDNHTIRYFRQRKQSAGVARNWGIREARSSVILMLDSDIIVNSEHLDLHRAIHTKYPQAEVAVLSEVRSPEGMTDLLRKEEEPHPLGHMPEGESIIGAASFATGAVSVKKFQLEVAGMFNPELNSVEDSELGYRLQKHGMILLFCGEAHAIHMRPMNTVDKVIACGKKYGLEFARNYGRTPLFGRECWRLGGRFDGGWHHFHLSPVGYLKDAIRRWMVNRLTIGPLSRLARRLPVTEASIRLMRRMCIEIWAYHYRRTFQIAMDERTSEKKNRNTHDSTVC